MTCRLTLFCRADCWSTAVRKPVGNVNPDNQKIMGGCAVTAHLENCSTRCTKSRVHDASGFMDGYAWNVAPENVRITKEKWKVGGILYVAEYVMIPKAKGKGKMGAYAMKRLAVVFDEKLFGTIKSIVYWINYQ